MKKSVIIFFIFMQHAFSQTQAPTQAITTSSPMNKYGMTNDYLKHFMNNNNNGQMMEHKNMNDYINANKPNINRKNNNNHKTYTFDDFYRPVYHDSGYNGFQHPNPNYRKQYKTPSFDYPDPPRHGNNKNNNGIGSPMYSPQQYSQFSQLPAMNNAGHGYGFSNMGYANNGQYSKGHFQEPSIKYIEKQGNDKFDDALYKEAKIEANVDGYQHGTKYLGEQVSLGNSGSKSGYNKGENYDAAGYSGYDSAKDYKGGQYAQTVDGKIDQKVSYDVDHKLNYRNNFNDENHSGSYKGSEFDVNYKSTDIEGGYIGEELSNKYKADAYDGANWKGAQESGGKYDGKDYIKNGDYGNDGKYRSYGYGEGISAYIPGGEDENGNRNKYGKNIAQLDNDSNNISNTPHYQKYGKNGNNNGNRELYNKYRSNNDNNNPVFGSSVRKQKGDYDKDGDYKQYGASFNGRDEYGKAYDNGLYGGARETGDFKKAFDRGTFREVDAKGVNKVATYEGDYKTNNQIHDVDYDVKHYENLNANFDNDINVDEYKNAYEGEDYKGGFDAENKYGLYNDNEYQQVSDVNQNYQDFQGEDYSEGIDADTKGKYKDAGKSNTNIYRELKKYPSKKYSDYGYFG